MFSLPPWVGQSPYGLVGERGGAEWKASLFVVRIHNGTPPQTFFPPFFYYYYFLVFLSLPIPFEFSLAFLRERGAVGEFGAKQEGGK